MTPQRIVLDSESKRARAASIVSRLPIDDRPWEVTVSRFQPRRSVPANRRYWLLVSTIAEATGHDKEEVHGFLRAKFLPSAYVQFGEDIRSVSPSTAKLKSPEFREYVERCENWSIQTLGVFLED